MSQQFTTTNNMGSSLSRIYNDYFDDYLPLCEYHKVEPKDIRDDFYEHLEELQNKENE